MIDASDVASLLLLTGLFSYSLDKRTSPPGNLLSSENTSVFKIFLVFLCWAVFTFISNIHRYEFEIIATSFWYIINLILMIVVYYFFSQEYWRAKREQLIILFIAFSVVEMLYALIGPLFFDVNPDRGTYIHHGMLGNVMVLSIGFGIYKSASANTWLFRIIYAIYTFASIYTLIISRSRSTLLGVIVSIAFFIFFYSWKVSKRITAGVIICILLISVIFMPEIMSIKNATFSASDTGTLDRSSIGRLLIWRGAVKHFLNSSIPEKIIGSGMGSFTTIKYDHYLEIGRFTTGAHNNLLHAAIELGIVGLLLFLAVFGVQLYQLSKMKKDLFAQIYFFITIALLFSGMTQETFWFQPVFGNFWMLQMIFLALAL
ncbi:MAG: O-antigen ligase family protein [Fibrobacter sp.]|nr:O-antigen ligase family protein [Fibrobacter sp.]